METCEEGVPVWFRLTARHQSFDFGNIVAVIQQIDVQTELCNIHVDENLNVLVRAWPGRVRFSAIPFKELYQVVLLFLNGPFLTSFSLFSSFLYHKIVR